MNKEILIVDDDDTFRRFIVRALASRGAAVEDCSTPSCAIEKINEKFFPLVICDIMMQEMNGIELAEKIIEKRPKTKFIFISGYVDNISDAPQHLKDRSVFLSKPFSPQVLESKINEL